MFIEKGISRRKLFRGTAGLIGTLAAPHVITRRANAAAFGNMGYARAIARKSAELAELRKAVFFLGGAGTAAQQQSYGIFNVKGSPFNATGNTILLSDGAMSSSSNPTHLSSASAAFVSGDIGKTVCVSGAGTAGAPLVTTIASISSGTVAVLSASAATTVSGTVVHYGTDDTAAFNSAVTAIYAAGGGVCYAPEGIYMIAGAFGGAGGQNAQIPLPFITNAVLSITFIGATHPGPPVFGLTVLSTAPPPTTGTILFSPNNGSGTSPAMIGAGPVNTSGSAFNNSIPTVANMTLRTAWQNPNPVIALNLGSADSAHVEAVYFDTDASPAKMGATAPVSASAGYVMPAINNAGYNVVRDCWATGYDQGFLWSEHGIMDNADAFLCGNAFVVLAANHDMHATRICPQTCKVGIWALVGASYLNIMNYDTEHNNTATHWFNTPTDVKDSSNFLNGQILNYFIVVSGTGPIHAGIVKTGGTNFTCTALFP